MKKIMRLMLVAVLAFSMTLAGCGGGDDAAGGDQGEAASDTIKIGINYELSGEVAQYGKSSVDGIMMAFDEINAAGGIDGKLIEPVQYDNKGEITEVTSLATKLMTKDKVVAVLGPATTGCFKAQEPLATQYQIPILSGSATADDVTVSKDGKVKDFVFRICFSDSYQGTAMAQYAAKNLNAKTVAIIMDSSSDYAKGLEANFTKEFTKNGGTIVAKEAYVAKDTDFNAILTKIKNEKFDAIYLPGYYNEAGLIIKQARALGITAPILGADGFDASQLAELAGSPEALSNVYFTNHYSALDQDPAVQTFIKGFNEKYGKNPDAFHALGYDCGKFIADAISRAGSTDSLAVKEALASAVDFKAVTGTLSMDESHNPVKAITVIELQNGVQAGAVKVGE